MVPIALDRQVIFIIERIDIVILKDVSIDNRKNTYINRQNNFRNETIYTYIYIYMYVCMRVYMSEYLRIMEPSYEETQG